MMTGALITRCDAKEKKKKLNKIKQKNLRKRKREKEITCRIKCQTL